MCANSECIFPPEAGTSCETMVGYMKVYVERARVLEGEVDSISDAVLNALEIGMKANVYSKGAIRNLVFIGERPPLLKPVNVSREEPPLALEASTTSEENNSGMSNTTIGLLAAVSASLFLLALLLLFLCLRRKKGDSTDQCLPTAKLDEEDGAMDISSNSGRWRRRNGQNKVAPIATNGSLEGAEIPGSLAAMDALALKPQFKREEAEDGQSSESEMEAAPLTPPRISRTVRSPVLEQATKNSVEDQKETGSVEASLPLIPASDPPPVPLSPVKNRRSGESPSRVSPKRLPSPLNEPFVSARSGSRSATVSNSLAL